MPYSYREYNRGAASGQPAWREFAGRHARDTVEEDAPGAAVLRLLLRSLFAMLVFGSTPAFAIEPPQPKAIELVGLALTGDWRMDNGYDHGRFDVTIHRVDGEQIFGTLSLASDNGCRATSVPFRGKLRGTQVRVSAEVFERSCSRFFTIGIKVTFDVSRGLPTTGTMRVFGFPGTLTLDRTDATPPSTAP